MAFMASNGGMEMRFAVSKYWTSIYRGDQAGVASVLADDISMRFMGVGEDQKECAALSLYGKQQVVENAMKIHKLIKGRENFGLKFHALSETRLLVHYEFSFKSDSTSEKEQKKNVVQLWTVKESDDKSISFTDCAVYDGLLSKIPDEYSDLLKDKKVFSIVSLLQSSEQTSSEGSKSCLIL